MGLAFPVWPDGTEAHRRDATELRKVLASLDDGLDWYADRTAAYPVALDGNDVVVLDRLYRAISCGIAAVIAAHAHDERIRGLLSLPDPLLELLGRTRDLPYRPGALRPDVLVDEGGAFRVCEVNARFPTNGFLCTYHTNEAVERVSYLAGAPVRPIPAVRGILDALCSRFVPDRPLVVLLERERGTEVFLLMAELARRGIDARPRRPSQLDVRDGVITDGGEPVEQFVLELERDELLDLPLELFDALASCPRSFNDVRTLILGHDKRMLAVLGRPELMTGLVEPADVDVLAEHIIPTALAGAARAELLADPAAWVLKRNSGGRGVDLLVGAACPPARWREAVTEEADDRAAQAHLAQRTFSMPMLTADGDSCDVEVHLVGLLPGFDGVPLGPGLFRASDRDVVNVAGGRAQLVPTMLAADVSVQQ